MAGNERTLKSTARGFTRFIEREAKQLDELQFFREAVQNEIEANATTVIIDGWRSADGYDLARVSGNGHGMNHNQLIEYTTTIHDSDKGEDNYGIGARVASLYHNQAGVVFASRTIEGEGMVLMHKYKGEYSLKPWIMDDGSKEDVVDILEDELENVPETGTAVILYGDGTKSTWDNSRSHDVHRYLVQRYFRFPDNVNIIVKHTNDTVRHTLISFSNVLERWSLSKGVIPFKNVDGLSGSFYWWLMPSWKEINLRVSGHNRTGSGIGLLVQDEIFQYDKSYMTDFGILYKSSQSKVVILISIEDARMNGNRTSVVYPESKKGDKTKTPWKALGKCFSENMPPILKEEMNQFRPIGAEYTDAEASLLDPEWQKSLFPVPVYAPANTGDPIIGPSSGDGLPPGNAIHGPGPGPGPNTKPRHAAFRKTGGKDPGKLRQDIVTPQVRFIPDAEMPEEQHPYRIYYAETSNEIIISEEMAPFTREIHNWVETGLPKSVVESAVRWAYHKEYGAHIIDSNAQKKFRFTAEMIENLKKDAVLFGRALGRKSLSTAIEERIRFLMKEQPQEEIQEETDAPSEPKRKRTWSKEDVEYLKTWARRKPVPEIAKYLGRTPNATRQKAFDLGISMETR